MKIIEETNNTLVIERRNSVELLVGCGLMAISLFFIGQSLTGNAPLLLCVLVLPHLLIGLWTTLYFASLHIRMDRRNDTVAIRWKSLLREAERTVSLSDVGSLNSKFSLSKGNRWYLQFFDGRERTILVGTSTGIGPPHRPLSATSIKVNKWIAQTTRPVITT